jgi:lambda family phage portal protein
LKVRTTKRATTARGAVKRTTAKPATRRTTKPAPRGKAATKAATTPRGAATPKVRNAFDGTRLPRASHAYEAAGHGRRLSAWHPSSSGPNRTTFASLQTLRNRSRDAVRNDWQAAAALRVRVSNIVGTGIMPRPQTDDETLKAKLCDLWDAWVPNADADGILDYYGMQALAERCRSEGGEVFIRARARPASMGLAVPVQFQLLEPEMIPLYSADLPNGNSIIEGIEFNKYGDRVAYWVYKWHPGDALTPAHTVAGFGLTDCVRVPADQVAHIYVPQRIGQIRGVPDGTARIAKLRTVADFDDAVLARQHTANLFTGFIKKNAPTPDGIDPLTGGAQEYDYTGAPMASLEPGSMQELLPGEDVVFAEPPDAGATYADFSRWQMLGITAADGIPYELMTGDISGTSDRTLRVILNEFHRMCEQAQWHILIPGLCVWVRQQWTKFAQLAGALNATEAAEAVRCHWAPQAWAYVNPLQDVQARTLEIEAGLRSRTSAISERGDDPVHVDEERAADIKREKDLGIPAAAPKTPSKPQPGQKGLDDGTDPADEPTGGAK